MQFYSASVSNTDCGLKILPIQLPEWAHYSGVIRISGRGGYEFQLRKILTCAKNVIFLHLRVTSPLSLCFPLPVLTSKKNSCHLTLNCICYNIFGPGQLGGLIPKTVSENKKCVKTMKKFGVMHDAAKGRF